MNKNEHFVTKEQKKTSNTLGFSAAIKTRN